MRGAYIEHCLCARAQRKKAASHLLADIIQVWPKGKLLVKDDSYEFQCRDLLNLTKARDEEVQLGRGRRGAEKVISFVFPEPKLALLRVAQVLASTKTF